MHRSPVACRQLASRARRHVQENGAAVRGVVDPAGARVVAEQFIAACTTGDLQALLKVLDPEVAGQTNSGGAVPAPHVRIVGRAEVARRLLAFLGAWQVTLVPMPVNAAPGAIAMKDGEVLAALTLDINDGVITEIRAVANPAKLGYVRSVLAGG